MRTIRVQEELSNGIGVCLYEVSCMCSAFGELVGGKERVALIEPWLQSDPIAFDKLGDSSDLSLMETSRKTMD